ncbi:MAG: flagellar filament capping protein FliD [Deltaproteobacteria bacterium]|nr:flagellar filament capping protein FliD [Deltaproteobacteria bacterium]MBZ0219230.1 flagellar filament capping protein FliD [Deltaproteobacteria bacterium]
MSISATSGVVSNIEYQSLITQLVSIRKQSINQLEYDKTALNKAKSAYSELGSKVSALVTAANALRTENAFNSFKATVSDSTYFTASASQSADAGTHEITINTLAKAHKIAADGVSSDTAVISSGGSFSFQVAGGEAQTIPVDSTTTLAGLKDSINALNAGVTASIVDDGSGENSYRLVLKSDTTGTAGAINITQNDTDLVFSTTLQAAQDATLTVDGLSVTRSSNTISDLITGVTLDLKAADPGAAVTLSVDRDTEEAEKKVKALIDAYNGVVSYIKSNNRYDSETKKGGPFFGDSVARSVWEDLRRVFGSAISGLPEDMNRLMHVGIKTGEDGLLTLDSSKFTSALSDNYEGVVDLFTKGDVSGFGELIHEVANGINDIVDGRIKNRQSGIDKSIKRIEEDILRKEAHLATYEEQLRAQFMSLETMLASLKNQGATLLNYLGGGSF